MSVDLTRCQGYGNCVIAAPDVFDLDDATNLVVLLDGEPDDALRDAVETAERTCPVQAISVTSE